MNTPATPQLQRIKALEELVESYRRLRRVIRAAEELAEELREEEEDTILPEEE